MLKGFAGFGRGVRWKGGGIPALTRWSMGIVPVG